MRIGLVCPYSLTVYGGVQSPGAGPGPLAPRQRPRRAGPRALRRTAARQRGDAPRQQHPDRRERLGRAAGARRPGAAPVHPGGAGRGFRRAPPARAARPRRHHDRLRAAAGPAGRHVPRGRHLGQLPVGPARGALAGRPARPAVRGVRRRARRWRRQYLGGTYEPVFNGIEIDPYAKALPTPTDGPTILFLGRHEDRKGLSVLLDAMTSLPPRRAAVGGRGRTRDRAAARAGRRRPAHRVARPDHRGREALAAAGGRHLLRAVATRASPSAWCCWRPWRRRPPSSPATWPATAGWPGPTRTPCSSRRATRTRWPARCESLLADPVRAEALVASGEERVLGFSMDRLADRYVELYERVGRDRGCHRSGPRCAVGSAAATPWPSARRCSPHGHLP